MTDVPAPQTAAIRFDRLTYRYPGAEMPALKDLSFSVGRGECLGVIGPNGAGKSTLCHALMGLVPHFHHGTIAGDAYVDAINVPDASLGVMPLHAGLVFQNPVHQFSGAKLTVAEEMAFGLENLGVDREVMRERIRQVSESLGLAALLDRNPFELSGGQMQRVAIASVMVLKPPVLILDEPTSQLDPSGTAEVFGAMETLRAEGVTIVVAEHKTEWLAEHCGRLLVLNEGRMAALGTPDEVFARSDAETWGVELPRYSLVFRRLSSRTPTVPTTLAQTVEALAHLDVRN